jgi:pyruvate,water dikinase
MSDKKSKSYVSWFEDLDSGDVPRVGGKNASLGEMIRKLKHRGIRVPDGFATTAGAYREYLETNDLADKIQALLDDLGGSGQIHRPGPHGVHHQ